MLVSIVYFVFFQNNLG